MGERALKLRPWERCPLPICVVATWMGRAAFLLPCCSSTPEAGGSFDPVVLRVGELSLAPTSHNTWESRSNISPEQHDRAKPVSASVGSQPQSCEHRRPASISHLSRCSIDEGKKPSDSPLMPGAGGKNWHCGHKSGRDIPDLYQVQHVGKQVLHPH